MFESYSDSANGEDVATTYQRAACAREGRRGKLGRTGSEVYKEEPDCASLSTGLNAAGPGRCAKRAHLMKRGFRQQTRALFHCLAAVPREKAERHVGREQPCTAASWMPQNR